LSIKKFPEVAVGLLHFTSKFTLHWKEDLSQQDWDALIR